MKRRYVFRTAAGMVALSAALLSRYPVNTDKVNEVYKMLHSEVSLNEQSNVAVPEAKRNAMRKLADMMRLIIAEETLEDFFLRDLEKVGVLYGPGPDLPDFLPDQWYTPESLYELPDLWFADFYAEPIPASNEDLKQSAEDTGE